jgi:hypothetical protein
LDLHVFSSFKSYYANLRTQPTKPQLKGKVLRTLHALHNASDAGDVYSAWRLGAIEIKVPSDAHHPGAVSLRTAMAVIGKACSDAQTRLAESDGQ